MKIIVGLLLSILTVTAKADVFAMTSQNVMFSLNPNGELSTMPQWSAIGPGSLQVQPNGMSATLVTVGAGTNTVTVSCLSGSLVLSNVVKVIITAPPATTLGLTTTLVPK